MRITFYISKVGDNYCAYAPAVPLCVATGETFEELQRTFPETLRFYFKLLSDEEGYNPQAEPGAADAFVESPECSPVTVEIDDYGVETRPMPKISA